jgi:hypothetical protein
VDIIEKVKGLSKKNKYIILGVAILVIGSSAGAYAYAAHNEQVQAQEQKQKAEEAYKQLLKDIEDLVGKAYESRKNEDIDKANEQINKLNKKDKKGYQEKISKLQGFIEQVNSTIKFIATAEKSKTQQDVDAAQKAIDGETDKYLANDKKTHQDRLDKVKAAIKDKKAKEEQAKKVAEEKKKAEEKKAAEAQKQQLPVENQQEQGTNSDSTSTAVAGNESANNAENNIGNANNGTNYQAPAQDTYTPPAQAAVPNQPVTPQSPAGNGNAGSQGGQQAAVPSTPATPSQPSKPSTPSGPPAGWIVPPYPIGSAEFVDWLFDNGYSGYDHSDGYIRPY